MENTVYARGYSLYELLMIAALIAAALTLGSPSFGTNITCKS